MFKTYLIHNYIIALYSRKQITCKHSLFLPQPVSDSLVFLNNFIVENLRGIYTVVTCGQAFVWYNRLQPGSVTLGVVACGQAFVWYNGETKEELTAGVVACGQAFVWYNSPSVNYCISL
ncbi:MAG: hypothetical protein HRU72_14290 [Planctomycetia bacterium]|nr:MAG: hypothetical protein HRU72_14290 [Planctomycetia bacterium]TVL96922.1 MAG: hypothetical protein CV082_05580 [Candidatus Brocadia sp. BL1]HQU32272.1 hypothetical protein [Candidatus Brocadia sapporoensis]